MQDGFVRFRPPGPQRQVWFRRPAWRLGPRLIFHGGYRQRQPGLGPTTMKQRQRAQAYQKTVALWDSLADTGGAS